MDLIISALLFVLDSAMDIAPIVFFLFVFQLFVMRERMIEELGLSEEDSA